MTFLMEYRFNSKKLKGLNSIKAAMLKGYELIVITTAHTNVYNDFVVANYKGVFDTKC